MLPELVKQSFWPSWKGDAGSNTMVQISNVCQKIMNKQDRIPGQSEMFEGQSPGCHLHPYLRQLCLSVPNDKVCEKCIMISGEGESYSLPSERGEEATIETSASGADAMVRVRLEEPGVF